MKKETNGATTPWAFSVVIEPDTEDGGYVIYCPTLKGCWSQGETVEEALQNITEAISGWLATHIAHSLETSRRNISFEPITKPLTLQVEIA